MRPRRAKRSKGFTLLEIMIVVSLLGLLAVLAIPIFVKARKVSQGRRIVHDARMMDTAISQWALDHGKKDGDPITGFEDQIQTYMKTPWKPVDILGNSYVIGTVGPTQIQISAATKSALAGVGIDWGPY
ncbi:MAG: type II secretion system GspH family protein [Verrucomicrobiae bacterium]|nr:type II secretion system GspH family protein [Verrucomicrobiae bacterium]